MENCLFTELKGQLDIERGKHLGDTAVTFNYNGATYQGTQKLSTTFETISIQSGNQLGELPQNLIKKYTISWNQGDGDVTPTGGDTSVEHTLSGWYTTETGGTQINSSTIVTGNKTYYAQYNQATGILNQPSNTSGLRLTKDIKFYNGNQKNGKGLFGTGCNCGGKIRSEK